MTNDTPDDRTPLIEQLGDSLRKQIHAGKLGRGGRLPSVRELAAQYRVSKSTIANAIARLKQQGLLQTAMKRGVYLANGQEHAPKKKRTGVIGVYARGSGDILRERVYFDAFNGIRQAAEEQGFTVLYLGSDLRNEDDSLELPLGIRDIDGLIYIVTSIPSSKFIREMARRKMPLVMVDSRAEQFDSVLIDNINGSREAVTHLIRLGHRKIAFLNSTLGQSSVERLAGYRAALEDAGLAFDPKLVSNSPPTVEGGRTAMRKLLKQQPTAAFGFSDYHGLGAILAAEDEGLAVPDNFSVISFGNEAAAFAQAMGNRLATMDVDMTRMGSVSAGLLLKRIGGFAGAAQKTRVECRIIEGGTTASAPAPVGRVEQKKQKHASAR